MNIPHITHIQDGVYIGRVRAHQEQVWLQKAGIRHILKLYESAPYWPEHFVVCDNEVEDGVLLPEDKLVRFEPSAKYSSQPEESTTFIHDPLHVLQRYQSLSRNHAPFSLIGWE